MKCKIIYSISADMPSEVPYALVVTSASITINMTGGLIEAGHYILIYLFPSFIKIIEHVRSRLLKKFCIC